MCFFMKATEIEVIGRDGRKTRESDRNTRKVWEKPKDAQRKCHTTLAAYNFHLPQSNSPQRAVEFSDELE